MKHLKPFKNLGWKFSPLMDQILPDAVPCGGHVYAPSLTSPSASMNMDTINKLLSVDKGSATLIADNHGSTTLSSSDAGALKAVGHKGDNLMQIDDTSHDVSSHLGNKHLPLLIAVQASTNA